MRRHMVCLLYCYYMPCFYRLFCSLPLFCIFLCISFAFSVLSFTFLLLGIIRPSRSPSNPTVSCFSTFYLSLSVLEQVHSALRLVAK